VVRVFDQASSAFVRWTEPFLVSLADDADFPRVPVDILSIQAD